MRLYLDDERPVPGGWTLARTATEAIDLLRTGQVEELRVCESKVVPYNPEGTIRPR